ncbi:MAG: ATP-binding cassette domain-containing protein [Bacilli bacterium]|jgi:putative ABC transport system ATP-binding protein|nr:ATP-binding cassette domain-containing protein [Bacilli bacterium]NLB40316.1 ATP-binding cassette domain-containing protein [Erysipelotrichaceae bacterium]
MLDIINLDKTFVLDGQETNKKHAIDHLSLRIEEGDFITIIGSNGSGKSTLLNLIAGSIEPDEGQILLDNENIVTLKNHRRSRFIGRVFQDPMLGTIGDMMVEENMFLANHRGKNTGLAWGLKKKQREAFQNMLEPLGLGLETRLGERMKNLSGGQRQSITLTMATMNSPRLLLLDEHTAALDPETAKIVMQITDDIVKKAHLTTIMVTHNMRDAIRYGNRLIMMADGKIIFDARDEEKAQLTVEELIKKFSEKTGDVLPDTVILNK